jgi:hypothetical protein
MKHHGTQHLCTRRTATASRGVTGGRTPVTTWDPPNQTTPQRRWPSAAWTPSQSDAGCRRPPGPDAHRAAAGGGKVDKRRMYNVIKVRGASAERERQVRRQYPSAAVSKAARRIFKKSNVREFTVVLMRRVSPRHAVRYGQGEEAGGLHHHHCRHHARHRSHQRDVDKKVRIVQSSDNPVGYLQEGGRESRAPPQTSSLVRGKGTNTLTPHQAPSPTRCRCEREQDGVAQHAERFYLHGGQEGVRYGLARRSRDLSPRPRSSESPSVRASARRPGTPSSRRRRPP